MRAPIFFLALMLTACSGQPDYRAEKQPPETVPHVDIERYQGLWYEIARYPNRFEDTPDYICTAVTAEYAIREDGRIDVINTCRKDTPEGEVDVANGVARVVGGNGAKLKVKFAPGWVPFASGDYWVLDLTEDYSAALVGSPDGKYLWLLSRTPIIPAETGRRLMEAARARGYETDPLQFTLQPLGG
ncbi:lipocalin family protein [Parvularcula marina]|uniref:lipocalin family protein n=1 Tax=Parvularcula marina TaxID=2292771 RepID=UPI003514E8B4